MNVDAFLIDEAPFQAFQSELVITPRMIESMIEYIQRHKFRRGDLVIVLLESLQFCLQRTRESTRGHEVLMSLDQVLAGPEYLLAQQERFFEDESEASPATRSDLALHAHLRAINRSHFWIDWQREFDITPPDELPHRWLYELLQVIELEKLLFGTSYTSRLSLRVSRSDNDGAERSLIIAEQLLFPDKSTPLIVLDGTPNLPEYERVFGREIVLYEGRVALQNRVLQLKSGEYTKTTLLGTGAKNLATQNRLLRIVEAIVQQGSMTLVVSIKEMIERTVAPFLEQRCNPERYRLAYYWGFRGSNEFKHCDQVILLGAANPNFNELVHQEGGSHLHEQALNEAMEAIWLPYEGTDLEVNVSGYADPRLNDALLFRRNHEMGQMIHRIRPLHDPTKTIWILTCVPVPGIPPTKLMTVEEMAGYLGLVNKSPRDKGALGHLVQVANDLLRDPGWFNRATLTDTSGFSTRTVAKHIGSVQQVVGAVRNGQKYILKEAS